MGGMKAGSKEAKTSTNQARPDINWAIVARGVDASNRKIHQSGEISAKDHVWLVVVARLIGKSVAAMIQTALYTYLRRNFAAHLNLLDFVAGREDLSREEAIQKIYDGEIDP